LISKFMVYSYREGHVFGVARVLLRGGKRVIETVKVARLRDPDYVQHLARNLSCRATLVDEAGAPMDIGVYGMHKGRKFKEMSENCHVERGYFNNSFCLVVDPAIIEALVHERGYFLIASGKPTFMFEGILLLADLEQSVETWKKALVDYAESLSAESFRKLLWPEEEEPF
jgi:hypothetical protein